MQLSYPVNVFRNMPLMLVYAPFGTIGWTLIKLDEMKYNMPPAGKLTNSMIAFVKGM